MSDKLTEEYTLFGSKHIPREERNEKLKLPLEAWALKIKMEIVPKITIEDLEEIPTSEELDLSITEKSKDSNKSLF
jgi:hypothetical protein